MTPETTAARSGDVTARPVRVIVVGRTALAGIDAVLRKDRSVELIRARTAFAAIGEAASPLDTTSPENLTVVVSPEAVPAARSAAFAKAVRRIDARARLVNVGERVLEGFDGAVRAGAEAGVILAAVRADGTERTKGTPPWLAPWD